MTVQRSSSATTIFSANLAKAHRIFMCCRFTLAAAAFPSHRSCKPTCQPRSIRFLCQSKPMSDALHTQIVSITLLDISQINPFLLLVLFLPGACRILTYLHLACRAAHLYLLCLRSLYHRSASLRHRCLLQNLDCRVLAAVCRTKGPCQSRVLNQHQRFASRQIYHRY